MSSRSENHLRDGDSSKPVQLFRHPLTVLSLFKDAVLRHCRQEGSRAVRSRLFRCFAVPIAMGWIFISMWVVRSRGEHLFATFDANGDGVVSADEFGAVYASLFGREMTWRDPASLPLVFQTLTSRNTSSLNASAFVQWWNAKPVAVGELYRHDMCFTYGSWREFEFLCSDAIYWLILGILSSIGLGTGMHSGLMFLFPHIYRTCSAADRCGNNHSFWTYPFYGPQDRTFRCLPNPPAMRFRSVDGLAHRTLLVLLPCVLWGVGTAVGEVPPYLLSYTAALKGHQHDALVSKLSFPLLEKMKGVWEFFDAVLDLLLCGVDRKGIFEGQYAGRLLRSVISGENVENLVWRLERGVHGMVPASWNATKMAGLAVSGLQKARHSISHPSERGPEDTSFGVATLLEYVVSLVLILFFVSIVEQLALEEYDRQQKVSKKKKDE